MGRDRTSGLSFEEFGLGDAFHSPGRTITEADIVGFAGLSGDYNPLHTDREFAARTAYRGIVAHGLLVQAVATGLADRIGIFDRTVVALAEMRIGFRAPVRPGDTVRLVLEVVEKEAEPGPRRGWVRFGTRVLNQTDDLVIEGEWRAVIVRHPSRIGATNGPTVEDDR